MFCSELADTTVPLNTTVSITAKDTGKGGRTYSAALRRQRKKGAKASKKGEEKQFREKYFRELLAKIGLKRARLDGKEKRAVEFSPDGTRDTLDVLCEDKKTGELVAVEFKVRDGERRGVEQLLRYTQQLASTKGTDPSLKHYKDAKIRAVLVTGIADQATSYAIATLDPYRLITWHVYSMNREGTKLESVTRRTVKRIRPVRALEISKASQVKVKSGESGSICVKLGDAEVELSAAAARRLHSQLARVVD